MRTTVFFFLLALKSFCQSDSITGPFVKLRNGNLLAGKNVQFSEKFMNKKIIIDGKEIPASTVSLFRNTENELYGNTSNVAAIFRKSFYSANDADFFLSGPAGTQNLGTLLFSHKLGRVKNVSATALKKLMGSNPEANLLIRKANVNKNICHILLGAAAGLFVLDIAKASSGNYWSQSTARGVEVIGSTCIIGSIIANGGKKRNTRAAIKKYYGVEIE
jgi:hypothetical protein